LALTNTALVVGVNTSNATISVLDRRTGRLWTQRAGRAEVVVTEAHAGSNDIELGLRHVPSGLALKAQIFLESAKPEFTFSLAGEGALSAPLRYPYPFVSEPTDRLVVPMNEGISFPVGDKSIETFRLIAYGGHGICMAFWGVTDDRQGHGVIIETPDDAAIHLVRFDDRLAVAPEWDTQKGQFGYARRLRYVFFDNGGHVAIAKRYREYALRKGILKTLAEKRGENPNVDLLVGAVNIWNWDADPVQMATQLRAAGIERILWSRGGSANALRALNDMKVLTSRYDIYQDTINVEWSRMLS
jgi:hypothetical protein